jgi:predicted  nucleic acid-binding Zn-ribbon protein
VLVRPQAEKITELESA